VWIREGIAHYYSEMLSLDATGQLPWDLSGLRFYVDGSEATARAYHASAYLVKFIIEELCGSDIDTFRTFASNPDQYSLIGVSNEAELFRLWHHWMARTQGYEG
jgi:hypothetical protein